MDYAAVYGQMHENSKLMPGYAISRCVDEIAELVKETNPSNLLDYGCGKGYQYLARRLHEKWGGLLPICYDIGVRQLAEKPLGKFDGVINTDVLEHIEEKDLPSVIDEIIGYASDRIDNPSFIYLCIACMPSKKNPLPCGDNAHVTIKHPDWWIQLIESRIFVIAPTGNKKIVVRFDVGDTFPGAQTRWTKTI